MCSGVMSPERLKALIELPPAWPAGVRNSQPLRLSLHSD